MRRGELRELPSIYVPDRWAYRIFKAGHVVAEFVKDAVKEKMKREGIEVE